MSTTDPTLTTTERQSGARRQLKTRDAKWAAALAAWLARRGVSPNGISVASVAFASVGGACYAATLIWRAPWMDTVLFLAAAGGIQLRLLCNLLDGMVAVEWGKGSRAGEIFNDLPDRLADTIILCAAGYAAAGRHGPTLGWAAAVAALLTAYLRVLGRAVGAGTYFIGPMAKQHRMALLTVASVVAAVVVHWGWHRRVLAVALGLIIAGSAVTLVRRLRRVVADLEGPAA
jgi:phosphatidylglycerophosphate synthase